MKKQFIMTGDVQVIETILPETAKIINKQPIAYGEKSGHIHVITGDYEMLEDGSFKYVKVGPKGAFSQHVHQTIWDKNIAGYDTQELLQQADHKPAKLLPNKVYKIGIHQVYDPYLDIKNKVID